jgi:hypothetical protein
LLTAVSNGLAEDELSASGVVAEAMAYLIDEATEPGDEHRVISTAGGRALAVKELANNFWWVLTTTIKTKGSASVTMDTGRLHTSQIINSAMALLDREQAAFEQGLDQLNANPTAGIPAVLLRALASSMSPPGASELRDYRDEQAELAAIAEVTSDVIDLWSDPDKAGLAMVAVLEESLGGDGPCGARYVDGVLFVDADASGAARSDGQVYLALLLGTERDGASGPVLEDTTKADLLVIPNHAALDQALVEYLGRIAKIAGTEGAGELLLARKQIEACHELLVPQLGPIPTA